MLYIFIKLYWFLKFQHSDIVVDITGYIVVGMAVNCSNTMFYFMSTRLATIQFTDTYRQSTSLFFLLHTMCSCNHVSRTHDRTPTSPLSRKQQQHLPWPTPLFRSPSCDHSLFVDLRFPASY